MSTTTASSFLTYYHVPKPTQRRFYSPPPRQYQYAPPPNPVSFPQISTWSFPHRSSQTFQSPSRASFADSQILQDVGATALVLGGAYSLVSTFDNLAQRNIINQSLSRKLANILSGLLFMASWPLFRELLKGPLYYVLVLVFCSVVFWRESPVGVICLAMMCGGDGVADIMGRNFGYVKLPYNTNKSWIGSISMFAFGFLISLGMLYYFSAMGYFQLNWDVTAQKVALVSCIATLVESLPTIQLIDDNISVPLVAMVTAYFCF